MENTTLKASKSSILGAHVFNFIKTYVNEKTSGDGTNTTTLEELAISFTSTTKVDTEAQSTQSQYRSPLHSHDERELSLNTNLMTIDDSKPATELYDKIK
jgi:hypothetical protein